MAQMRYDFNGGKYLAIPFDTIVEWAREEVMLELVAKEVRKALEESEDFRILVREGVRDAMAKLNIGELVQAAVTEVLKQRESADVKPG